MAFVPLVHGKDRQPLSITEQESLLRTLGGYGASGAMGGAKALFYALSRPFHAVTGYLSGTIKGAKEEGVLGALFGGPSGALSGFTGGKYGDESLSDEWIGDVLGRLGIPRGPKLGDLSIPGLFEPPVIGAVGRALNVPKQYTLGGMVESVIGTDLSIPVYARDIPAGIGNALFDPLMYVGIGAYTKIGLLAKKAGLLAPTLARRIAKGQQSGFSIGLPFKEGGIALTSGKYSIQKPAELWQKFRSFKIVEDIFGKITDPAVKMFLSKQKYVQKSVLERKFAESEQIFNSLDNLILNHSIKKEDAYLGMYLMSEEKSIRKGFEVMVNWEKKKGRALPATTLDSFLMRNLKAKYKGKSYENALKLEMKTVLTGIFRGEGREPFIELSNMLRRLKADMLYTEQKFKIPIDKLSDESLDYLYRMATPTMKRIFHDQAYDMGVKFSHGAELINKVIRKKGYQGLNILELNSLFKTKFKRQLEGGPAFIMDPMISTVERIGNHAKAVSVAELTANLISVYARPKIVGQLPGESIVVKDLMHLGDRWVALKGDVFESGFQLAKAEGLLKPMTYGGRVIDISKAKSIKGLVFPNKIADVIMEAGKIYKPGYGMSVVKWWNRYLFKPWATIAFPAFYVRNNMDNVIRLAVRGMWKDKESYTALNLSAAIMTKIGLDQKNIPPLVKREALTMMDNILEGVKAVPGKAENLWYKGLDFFFKGSALRGMKTIEGASKDVTRLLRGVKQESKVPLSVGALSKEIEQWGVFGSGYMNNLLWNKMDIAMSTLDPGYVSKIITRFKGEPFKKGSMLQKMKKVSGEAADVVLGVVNPERLWWTTGWRKVNADSEDIFRGALYIYNRMKGMNEGMSFANMNKYMYDYATAGRMEQQYIKHLLPFWQFTRNNIPFWASQIAQKPILFSTINKLLPARSDFYEVPSFINEGIPIQISTGKDGKKTYIYSFGLSIEDLNKFATNLEMTPTGPKLTSWMPIDIERTYEKFVSSSMTPLFKFFDERRAGRDFFFNTSIDSYAKAYGVLKILPNFLQKMIGFKEKVAKDGTIFYRMNPYKLHALRNSPVARMYSTFGRAMDGERSAFQRAMESIAGVRTAIVEPNREKRRFITEALSNWVKEMEMAGAPVNSLRILYIPQNEKHLASPELQRAVQLLRLRVEKLK